MPQPVGEGEADLGVGLDLVDPLDLILHGVLHGNDIGLDGFDLRQGRIEGGGLPAPRGSRQEDHAVGFRYVASKDFQLVIGKS